MNNENDQTQHERMLEDRRSGVRVWVTRGAAGYVFVGIPLLVAVRLVLGDNVNIDAVKDLYLLGVPVASGVIGYWFAARDGDKRLQVYGKRKDQDDYPGATVVRKVPPQGGAHSGGDATPPSGRHPDPG